jgi:hypothetical protein
MRKGLSLFFVVTFISGPAFADSKQVHRYNDHPFQCGAAYRVSLKLSEQSNDLDKAALYQAKFDRLVPEEEQEFEARGRSRGEVAAYVQQYTDDIMMLSEKDKGMLPSLLDMCDSLYP